MMSPTRTTALFALLCATLPTAGCCSLSRLWCGPEDSPWVDRDLTSPDRAARTFLEAARREDFATLFGAMSTELKKEMGLDTTFEQTVAQKLLKEELPYLYVAGYADPGPAGQSSTGAHMRHVLDCYQCCLQYSLR